MAPFLEAIQTGADENLITTIRTCHSKLLLLTMEYYTVTF